MYLLPSCWYVITSPQLSSPGQPNHFALDPPNEMGYIFGLRNRSVGSITDSCMNTGVIWTPLHALCPYTGRDGTIIDFQILAWWGKSIRMLNHTWRGAEPGVSTSVPYPWLYHGFLPTMSKWYKTMACDISLSSVMEARKGERRKYFRPLLLQGRRLTTELS